MPYLSCVIRTGRFNNMAILQLVGPSLQRSGAVALLTKDAGI